MDCTTTAFFSFSSTAQLASGLKKLMLLCLGLAFGFFGSIPSIYAQTPLTQGYRDFNYDAAPQGEITGEKPQSKLWWNDGFWWAVLWANDTDRYRIHRFDLATQSWISIGVAADERSSSKYDALWDGQKLYVASHIHTTSLVGPTTTGQSARLYRYSYNTGTKTYSLDSGFPVIINGSQSEALVLDKDSTGKLWITWVELGKVKVNRTLGDDLTWGTPFDLPVQGNDVHLDDISSVVAFGGSKIGIMWSNQNDFEDYFAVHLDGNSDSVWEPREEVYTDPLLTSTSDDHLALRAACDGSGIVYGVTKTALNGSNPDIVVVKRSATGVWTNHVFSTAAEHHTRPTLVIDQENQKMYVFARSTSTGQGIMYMKSADLSNLNFPPGLGTPFIESTTDLNINNPTSTKQCLDGNSGLLVLASDKDTRNYFHNYIDLTGDKPTITSFTPVSGPVGTLVTITGSNFNGAAAVAFNGTPATSFTVDSDTQIRVNVPAGATTGKISVTNAIGTRSSVSDFTLPPPATLTLEPLHDTRVKLSTPATNYGTTGSLRVENAADVENTYLKFDVTGLIAAPLSAKLRLFVTNASTDGGSVYLVSNNYQSTSTPWTETGLTWDNAPAISGTALSAAGAVSINTTIELDVTAAISGNGTYSFGIKNTASDRADFSSKEDTNPPELVIETNSGSSTPPNITSFTPSTGSVGTQVTISGINFTGATTVMFGTTAASGFTVDSDTQIRATVPTGATTGKISVTNADGTGFSATDFTVLAPPALTSFTPTNGPIGIEVTISGSNFTSATNVNFNGAAASFTIDTDTQIRATVPSGASTGKIGVTNPIGTVLSVNNFTVTLAPLISSFTPTGGPVGTEVTLTGLNFTGATNVAFNGAAASSFTVDADTQIRASVPTGATTGKISVTTADGTGLSATDFTLAQLPVITSFTPSSGPPGTEVTINGNTFTGAFSVVFNGTVASFILFSDTQIRATVPTSATAGKISVTNADGTGFSVNSFSVSPAVPTTTFLPLEDAHVRDSSPNTSFGTNTEIRIQAGSPLYNGYLKFNVTGLVGTVINAKLRLFVTNESEDGGSVFVVSNNYQGTTNPWDEEGLTWNNAPVLSGAALSSAGLVALNTQVELDVTSAITGNGIFSFGLRSNSADRVIYSSKEGATPPELVVQTSPSPIISAFTPPDGPLSSEVTITGFYFDDAIGVTFNGVVAGFTVDSDTQIRATVPAGATTGKIGVTNTTATGLSTNNFLVTTVPAISSFTPSNGPVASEVTITGASFAAISGVTFNGVGATAFTVDSDTQLRATVPASATIGKIAVSNSAGTGLSTGDFTVTVMPAITAFTPSDGPAGTEVTVSGSNFVVLTGVAFNGIAASTFTVDSNTQLRAVVPAGATTGKIGVTNSAGTGQSANNFIVAAQPAISSFIPADGPVGTEVTLTGTHFTVASGVSFNGFAATSFAVDSDTQLRAQVPAGATAGQIAVTNSAGTGTSADNFIVTSLPVVTSFAPANGVTGSEVTITGNAFIVISSVSFNGTTAASFTVDSDTQIRATVPAGATTGKIGVTNSAGTGLSTTDLAITSITSFTPTNGPVATEITISGTQFNGITGVTFNGTAATGFSIDSDAQIRATVPAGATTGKIGVATAAGTALSANDFIVTTTPAITAFTPSNGPATTEVTITGNNFAAITGVSFNSMPASTFTVDSPAQIRAQVPSAATTGKITVSNSGGTATSAGDFIVTTLPAVTSFTPADGPEGTPVTITGVNFIAITGVSFNGTAATNITVNSNTEILAEVPAGATTGQIGVSNSAGAGASTGNFIVTQIPTITSFLPVEGPIGTEVTLTGNHFDATSGIAFNGTSASSFTIDSNTQIRTTVPVGATRGKISVTNSAGSSLNGDDFIVRLTPTIASFAPANGPVGIEVTISGLDFTGATGVTFNGVASAVFTVDSDAQLRATVPAGAAAGKIAVTNPQGTGESTNDFVVTNVPAITSFTPVDGPAGTEVTLAGAGFTAATGVTFNGAAASAFALDSDTQLRATVPAGATTGKIEVFTSAGSGQSIDDFIITSAPAASFFAPLSGVFGTEVTITGTNFIAVTSVNFNGTPAASFTIDSATQLRAVVPGGASTGKISVSNSAGTGISANDFLVTAITAFTPSDGPVGTEVTITVTNIAGATGVTFNGTPSAGFTVDSGTQIRANVPSGATAGKIGLTTLTGTALSTEDFVVTQTPSITSFSPISGPVSSEVTITGLNFAAITSVTFGGTPASSLTVDSATRIRAVVPAGATTGQISVVNSAGTASSAGSFVITAVPVVNSFTPADGAVGTPVTVTGLNFIGSTQVLFNATIATIFAIDSDTQIRANVPAGASTGKIHVVNSAGSGSSANNFIVTQAPVITSFNPATGAIGTEVTLSGNHFAATTAVAFNGTNAATFTVDSDTQLRATVPTGATTGKISVTNSAGTGLSGGIFTVKPPPVITSFTPTSGQAGAEVTITGANFTGATNVAFNGVAASSFNLDSDTQIRATVPAVATTGKISVTTVDGTGVSASDFIVTAPPAITSFTPTNGPTGSEITVTGSHFVLVSGVTFNGVTATSFTIDSETQLRAMVPAGATTGKISVTNTLGSGLSVDDFIVTALPAITAFTPANGPVGSEVTISGNNFVAITGVTVNGIAATNFAVDSNTQLRATVPAGASSGKIGIANSAGTGLSSDNFTVTALPAITSFAPSDGPSGLEVTVTGTNFIAISSVTFNGTTASSFTVDSDTQIRATVPSGASTGKIAVINSAGSGISANNFVVTTVPSITSFSPNNGPVSTEVTLTGNNFTAVTGVSFDGTAATAFTVDSDTQLRATVPAGATTGKITVTNSAGTSISPNDFIITTTPVISSFTPNTGPAGTEVTISGTNFDQISGVTFNSVPAVSFTVDSGTLLRATIPNGATTGKIRVTNSAGSGESAGDFTVTFLPAITSFTPSDGPLGTPVTISGAHFVNITSVRFNGIAATSFTVDSETQLRANVPVGATTGDISVINAVGTGLSAENFIVTQPPSIFSFTPAIGPIGTEVTITGNNFAGANSVTFNGTPATSLTVDSNTQIRANVPTGATTGKIGVGNSAGTSLSGATFTVNPPPIISSFTPTVGPVGIEVTISGNHFTGATAVAFNGTPATSFTVNSNTQIRATVPSGASTGKISVTTADGAGSSADDFVVTSVPSITSFTPTDGPAGTEITITGAQFFGITAVSFNSIPAASFTVDSDSQIRATVPAGATTGKIGVTNAAGTGQSASDFIVTVGPAITSFTPASGVFGTEVTVTGGNFVAVTAVTFNGVTAASFEIDSGTQLRATVPAGAATGKIAVSNSAGTAESAGNFQVMAITSFTPSDGPAGVEVTITGVHFSGITGVTFNGTAVSSFTVDSPTSIRANVPAGAATGKIGVTGTTGTALSANDFIVTLIPAITSFTPDNGPVGAEVTVTGTNFAASTSVSFNGLAASNFTVDSNTQLRATVPDGATTGKISITNSAGTGLSADDFLVTLVPLVTSFTPGDGPVGTPVTITGNQFTGVTSVTFDGVAATTFTVDSNTQIRANVPPGASTGKISAINSAGAGQSANNFIVTAVPVIASFTPITGPQGTEVTLTGSNFDGASSVAFNGTAAASFAMDSNAQIRAQVPVGATTGKISVSNSAGTGLSGANFTVEPPPLISSFTPTNGPVGTEVTITGAHFTGASNVTFNGTAGSGFTVDSEAQIRATVPAGAATGKIGVTTPDGSGLSATDFIVIAAPIITSFTPSDGPAGTEVTLNGAQFVFVSAVSFNGVAAASFSVDSEAQLRAVVPTGTTTGKIAVANSVGNISSTDDFIVTMVPAISAFAPTGGTAGTEVTLTGNHFVAAAAVTFNGIAAASFAVDSNTQLRAVVPTTATSGKIAITNSAGTGTSIDDFIVTAITAFSPSDGPAGTEVTLIGNNFTGITGVTFNGGAAASFIIVSATQIRATVPAGATTGRIGITSASGAGFSSSDFIVTSLPVVGAFSPSNGPVGSEVTISGSNFAAISNVTFNGASAAIFSVDSENQLRATVPAGATSGKIAVGNSAGTAVSADDFIVTAAPVISSFTSADGPVGTAVTLTGTGFIATSTVRFNGTPATGFSVDSDTQIRATVPTGATTGKIAVTNSAGTGQSANDFIVTSVPGITAFAPSDGPIGSEVTLTGSNFATASSVTFIDNGTTASFTIDSDTQLRATVPSGATTGKIAVTNSAGTGQSANDFIVTQTPVITSFIPPDGPVGTEVTLAGTDFTAIGSVTFNGTAAANFTVASETQLRATVPFGATTGKIAITNSAGTGQSTNDFVVTAGPAIASFTPGDGPIGTEVTLTGANFIATTGVTFHGTPAASFAVDSDAQLRATVPAGAATGKIAATNSAGTGQSANDFIVTQTPVVTSFTPTNGPIGAEVTLTGTDFTVITTVTFNGTTATNFTVDSQTQLRATVPVGATTGKIAITNSAGTGQSANDFIVTAIPAITSFTPADGPISTEVTLTGTDFVEISGVAFNGTAATFSVDSATQLRTTVPAGAATGKIAVTNSAGTGQSANDFIVTAIPAITAFAPSDGPVGSEVTLTGNNFTATASVTFNGTAASSFTVDSDTQLRVAVPGGAATGKISVTNSAGSGITADDFIVTATPIITSFTPSDGPVSTEVTLTGDHFTAISGVTFNGTAATNFTVDSNTQLRATVPGGATSGKIGVTNSAGSTLSANNFVVIAPPGIASFTPVDGPAGTEVTIAGAHFAFISAVTFNGVAATSFTLDSETQLRVTVPAGATSGKIGVANPAGTTLSTGDFIVTVTPVVTTFTPANGPISTEVTLIGNHFVASTSVKFNGTPATSFTIDSNTQLRANVPDGTTTGKISVTNSAGTGVSATNFVVTTVPAITSFSPSDGPIGAQITITGHNFVGVTGVKFNGAAATSFTADSETQLRATVPTGATTGKIAVTNSAGTGLSVNDFIVTATPAITSFTPVSGPVGAEVTINGNNFTGTNSVTFNGITAGSFIVDTNTQLRAIVPTGATTGKIAVSNSAGSALSAANFTVTTAPSITSFTPANGPVGILVTITGNNFAGASGVKFNGVSSTGFAVDSNNQIRALVPAGASTGKISVINSAGSGMSATDFIVTVNPAITAFTPANGPVGTEVTVTGTGLAGVTSVKFNGVEATVFTVDSNTQLRATAPTGATTGKISATNSAGTTTSANDFVVTNTPAIASFTPPDGPIGTIVTITGNNFINITNVAFNGTSASGFTVDSNTQLRATVPAGAEIGKIGVTNSAGTGLSATDFIVTSVPEIVSFSPDNGPVGTVVTVTGTHFNAISSVTFNGVAATGFTVDSATQLRATVPSGVASGKIGVGNSAGTSLSGASFLVTAVPLISSFTPESGLIGAIVTITGNNFNGATSVTFNGVAAASFTVMLNTQLQATVPAGATTGKIGVANSAGSSLSVTDFNVTQLPVIASFTPLSGSEGTEVTISGSHFTAITVVAFDGGAAASFSVDSNTQLRATVPVGASSGKISVTNAAGTAISAGDFTVTAPILTFSPIADAEVKSSSPTANFGGNSIMRLRDGSVQYRSYLKFSVAGISGSVARATLRLFVNESSDDGGTLHLVSNNYSTGATPWEENGLIWNNAPSIGGVSSIPDIGPVTAGTFVELEVTSLVTGNGIYSFGLLNGSTTIANYGTKEGANPPQLVIETSEAPGIFSFTPPNGTAGTEITITGIKFTGVTAVAFNGIAAASVTVDSDTQLRATVPVGATTGRISATNAEGTGESASDFIVAQTPAVTSFTPANGPVGTEVTITGNHFTSITEVAFNNIPATSFVVESNTQIRAQVPAGATTGKISVSNAAGTGVSATDFTVISSTFTFNPVADAEVKSSSPAANFGANSLMRLRAGSVQYRSYLKFQVTGLSGPIERATLRLFVNDVTNDGGAVFLVSNNYATNATPWDENGMTWNNAPLISGTPVVSAIGAVVAGAFVELDVTSAITGDGTYSFGLLNGSTILANYSTKEGANSPQLVIKIDTAPRITSFTPASGSAGTEVTVTGLNFTGATAVAFNGTPAANFAVDSNTQIRATVPLGASTGKISVTNADGTGSSATDFSVTAPPMAFTPIHDTEVKSSSPTANFGTNAIMRVRAGSVQYRSYMKFNVTGLSGPISRATLRLFVNESSDDGGSLYLVSGNYAGSGISWSENGLVWNNAPAIAGTPVAVAGAVTAGAFVELNVTSAVTGNGLYSFALLNASTTVANYSTKEGANPPQLVIETGLIPIITSFAPASGLIGSEVTITGSHFAGTTGVSFNGTTSTNFTVDSDTQLRATVPAGASTGKISVTTGSGTGISVTDFAVAPSSLTFNPTDDAEVKSSFATTNYGTNTIMRVRVGSVQYRSYLKFNVTGLTGTVQSATLRLHVDEGGDDGGAVYLVSNDYAGINIGWVENGLIWNNAPTIGGTPLSTAGGTVTNGAFVELDVTSAITGNGAYSFALMNASTSTIKYGSKEGAHPPQLVIQISSGSSSALKLAGDKQGMTNLGGADFVTSLPERLTLHPNHPNPFNAQTTIEYTLPLSGSVELVIFNIYGQAVRRLVDGAQTAGQHRVVWDGKDERGNVVASGIYYYRLNVDKEIRVRQMTVVK